jgi:hypothetical protein
MYLNGQQLYEHLAEMERNIRTDIAKVADKAAEQESRIVTIETKMKWLGRGAYAALAGVGALAVQQAKNYFGVQ